MQSPQRPSKKQRVAIACPHRVDVGLLGWKAPPPVQDCSSCTLPARLGQVQLVPPLAPARGQPRSGLETLLGNSVWRPVITFTSRDLQDVLPLASVSKNVRQALLRSVPELLRSGHVRLSTGGMHTMPEWLWRAMWNARLHSLRAEVPSAILGRLAAAGATARSVSLAVPASTAGLAAVTETVSLAGGAGLEKLELVFGPCRGLCTSGEELQGVRLPWAGLGLSDLTSIRLVFPATDHTRGCTCFEAVLAGFDEATRACRAGRPPVLQTFVCSNLGRASACNVLIGWAARSPALRVLRTVACEHNEETAHLLRGPLPSLEVLSLGGEYRAPRGAGPPLVPLAPSPPRAPEGWGSRLRTFELAGDFGVEFQPRGPASYFLVLQQWLLAEPRPLLEELRGVEARLWEERAEGPWPRLAALALWPTRPFLAQRLLEAKDLPELRSFELNCYHGENIDSLSKPPAVLRLPFVPTLRTLAMHYIRGLQVAAAPAGRRWALQLAELGAFDRGAAGGLPAGTRSLVLAPRELGASLVLPPGVLHLRLAHCQALGRLPTLPATLRTLHCVSLDGLTGELSGLPPGLRSLQLQGLQGVASLDFGTRPPPLLARLRVVGCAQLRALTGLEQLRGLAELELRQCPLLGDAWFAALARTPFVLAPRAGCRLVVEDCSLHARGLAGWLAARVCLSSAHGYRVEPEGATGGGERAGSLRIIPHGW